MDRNLRITLPTRLRDLTGSDIKVESNDDELYVAYVNYEHVQPPRLDFTPGLPFLQLSNIDAELKTLRFVVLIKDGTSNIVFQASNFTQFDEIKWMKRDGENFIETGEVGEFFYSN